MRKLCLAYWVLLTLLLLASNPGGWLGLEETASSLFERIENWSHLICFTLLSMLVFITRWPIGRGWLLAVLVAYSAGTEVLQMLVPTRRAELKDFAQDVAGILLGATLAWICRSLWQARPVEKAGDAAEWQQPRRREATLAAGNRPDT